uniref:Uncharacterized protein n=1 Tax=Oryza rufipogon TaxID=4529 RepID=A0A0E0QSC2_ORYRU
MSWAAVTSDTVEKGVDVGGGGMGIGQWLWWPNQLVRGARRHVVTSAFPLSSPTIATTSRRVMTPELILPRDLHFPLTHHHRGTSYSGRHGDVTRCNYVRALHPTHPSSHRIGPGQPAQGSTDVLAGSASLLLSSAICCDSLPRQSMHCHPDTDRASLRPFAPATPFWHTNPELCVV